jgi:hypothetical protein
MDMMNTSGMLRQTNNINISRVTGAQNMCASNFIDDSKLIEML